MDSYTVILSPEPDSGVYSVTVPAMPGAITEGETREAALSAVAEVMATWLEIALGEGYEPLPETPEVIGRQVASVIEDRQAEGWDTAIETMLVRPAALVAQLWADLLDSTGAKFDEWPRSPVGNI